MISIKSRLRYIADLLNSDTPAEGIGISVIFAIAVIAEDGGSGSSTAVPIAKYIFDTYYQNKYGY